MKFAILVIYFFLSSINGVLAGQERGNGVDNVPVQEGSAWFINRHVGSERKITVCQKVSKRFGKSEDETKIAIETAFSIWKKYMIDKDVFQQSGGPVFGDIVTDVEFIKNCTGNEDLTFLLGVHTDISAKQILNYHRPAAFAHRVYYDQNSWGNGYVWVADQYGLSNLDPDPSYQYPLYKWSYSKTLVGILLHEIGHILGINGHVTDTIMDSEKLYDLVTNSYYDDKRLTSIDWGRELVYQPLKWNEFLPSVLGIEHDVIAKIFFKFTGRYPATEVQQILSGNCVYPIPNDKNEALTTCYTLYLKDNLGQTAIPIWLNEKSGNTAEGPIELFKIIHLFENGSSQSHISQKILNMIGLTKDAEGKEIVINFIYNGRSPNRIQSRGWFYRYGIFYYGTDMKEYPLFVSDQPIPSPIPVPNK